MISVIIPAYKKTDQLLANLTINLPFLNGCEIIVVNDDPSESIKAELKEFDDIQIIENTKNLGFAGAVNTGMKAAKGDYFLLLNSDVVLKDNSYLKALSYFSSNPNMFAVGFAQVEQGGDIVGKNAISWIQGLFVHTKAFDIMPGPTAWAEGGSSLFDAKKVKELNYFDVLFSPFYWEDLDLSYRAWKRGYEIVFAPEIQVEHHHESTIGAFYRKDKIQKIAYRHQLLFIWKNITDLDLIIYHWLMLPLNTLRILLKGEFQFILALFEALSASGKIERQHKKEKNQTKLTDAQILQKFT
jgi:GT2 family glycosyltransferase